MKALTRLLVALGVAMALFAVSLTIGPAGASTIESDPICIGAGIPPYTVRVCTP